MERDLGAELGDHARECVIALLGDGGGVVAVLAHRLHLPFQLTDPAVGLGELVHHHDRGHDGNPEIADLPDCALRWPT